MGETETGNADQTERAQAWLCPDIHHNPSQCPFGQLDIIFAYCVACNRFIFKKYLIWYYFPHYFLPLQRTVSHSLHQRSRQKKPKPVK